MKYFLVVDDTDAYGPFNKKGEAKNYVKNFNSPDFVELFEAERIEYAEEPTKMYKWRSL